MASKVQRHVHKYEQKDGQWFCAYGTCTHFIPKNVVRGVLGRQSICWSCGCEFFIDNISVTQPRPKCQDCDADNPIRTILENKVAQLTE